MNRLLVQYIINGNELDKDIEYGIRTTTCEVAKSLRRDDPGERFMTKINEPYDGMSDSC